MNLELNSQSTISNITRPFNIDDKDDQGMTCLMKAAMSGHLEVVELLLTYGANPRTTNPKDETALSLAILEGKLQVSERLLVAKSDVG